MTRSDQIMVSERIAQNLVTRRAADELFDFVRAAPQKKVTVDFKSVKFASRSFVHEYLMLKGDVKKKVVEKNMPVEVRRMFEFVSKQDNSPPQFSVNALKPEPLSLRSL